MFSRIPLHRLLALVVFVAAALWVLTGHFAAVGSEEAEASEAKAAEPLVETPKRTVAVVRAEVADYARLIRIPGVTEADKLAILAARSNGVVQELGAEPGDVLERGATVLLLEGEDVRAAVKAAEDQLAQAAEQLAVGEALNAKGSLPETEVTSRRAAKTAAEGGLAQAQAAADRLSLTAPFAGTVDAVNVEIGEWVQAGTPIATLIALDPIVVKAEVSEQDVAHVTVGAKALVRLVSGVELEGTVRHLARKASDKTRTFALEVDLPNPEGNIPSGMTAEVRLSAAMQPALTVPRSVLTLNEAGQVGLRVVNEGDVAGFLPVQLIDDTEEGFVVAGVPQGARVIVAGQDLVRDGDPVIAKEMTRAEAEAAQKAAEP
ncbi:efflux RND transporter periplasmic adaptor subunit [Tabrizicola oligotrophica]|uniref:Efflux RND transporter periplasmic adaptor subunit n=1 Tax=Tabrizicola oligotrophica TaxID=2710650 RepID=A0A6M0QUL5_9RHOB|nr:efflux RND transporter periplasmic adaptor subunit [Tabrizicola oligotrophica]NEY90162.1 efflux RND transporter periplasmic adaptor subunit [Tabrizicola oligotrophica]